MKRHYPGLKLPDTLALFPLSGAILIPGTRLPLRIFEPRYLTMLDDVLKTSHRLIGIVQPHQALSLSNASDNGLNLYHIGSAGRVVSFSESEDGRYLITLAGIRRFRIKHHFQLDTPYICCEPGWSEFEGDQQETEGDPAFNRSEFLTLVTTYLAKAKLATRLEELAKVDVEKLVNSLAMLCPFQPKEKQALLEAASLTKRRETLMALMQFAIQTKGSEGGTMQ